MQRMESPTEEDRHDAGEPASSSIPPVLQEVDVMKASRKQLAAQRTPLRADGVLKAAMLTITLVHLSPHTKPFYVAKNLHELDAYRLGQHNILPMLGFTGCSKDKLSRASEVQKLQNAKGGRIAHSGRLPRTPTLILLLIRMPKKSVAFKGE